MCPNIEFSSDLRTSVIDKSMGLSQQYALTWFDIQLEFELIKKVD